ncbi:MAG: PAC2 family protein [Chloroflexi bacterium]|nr:PAC2 family protein [Chloroflexota bacterium]
MDDLLELAEIPNSEEACLIVGWRQWADAGAVSSELPQYLIDQTGARKIGAIKSDPFYFFQIPGTQHFLRPEIKLTEGHRAELRRNKNEIFYADNERKGLFVFLGDEPHLNIERYAQAFFNLVQELKVKRVAAMGGVYAPVPYDKDRQISCIYSLPRMKKELGEYAVRFSNYEGGVTIGSYLSDRAEQLGIEYLVFNAMVPMYDFSELAPDVERIIIDQDYKAWFDLMRRFNYLFKLGIDLSHLEQQSRELVNAIAHQIETLEKQAPQAQVREYLAKVNASFNEPSFMPLDDVWKTGLKDLFSDSEE